MKKFMIDSNIVDGFIQIQKNQFDLLDYSNSEFRALKNIWQAFLSKKIELTIPRDVWIENIGASDDCEQNQLFISFISKYFSAQIYPKTKEKIAESFLLSQEYLKTQKLKSLDDSLRPIEIETRAFRKKSSDDAKIMAEATVCGVQLITRDVDHFIGTTVSDTHGERFKDNRRVAIKDVNVKNGYDESLGPVTIEEASQQILEVLNFEPAEKE